MFVFVCASVYLCMCQSVCVSLHMLSVSVVNVSVCVSVCSLFLCLPIHRSVCLSLFVCFLSYLSGCIFIRLVEADVFRE